MGIKLKAVWFAAATAAMLSCGSNTKEADDEWPDEELWTESDEQTDSLEVVPARQDTLLFTPTETLDGFFNDFLFAYLHSRKLRNERTATPLRLEHKERPAEILDDFDPEFEFSFLSGEYFTTLYGNNSQMQAEDDEELEEDSIVSLQRINLNDGTIRNFQFLRQEGRWTLEAIREATFDDDELNDFLHFYARFCTDSAFQNQSIANPLHIVLQYADDGEESVDGTIDADQWQTFCPEVPSGIVSNIRKGQHYSGNRVILRKSGLSNGLQDIFTFTKDRNGWHLSEYEN